MTRRDARPNRTPNGGDPLTYLLDGERLFIFAAKGGSPTNPDWYHNLVAHPQVTVELGTEQLEATAVLLEGEERDQIYTKEMHAKPVRLATRGTYQPRPLIPSTLIRITVTKLPKQTREPKPLWLWWHAPTLPDLERVWQAYRARFQLEHFFKFAKYQLNWMTPRVRQPEQADRWTQLILLAYTMMRLARPVVSDQRLPWECPLTEGNSLLIGYAVPFRRSCQCCHISPTHRNLAADRLVVARA